MPVANFEMLEIRRARGNGDMFGGGQNVRTLPCSSGNPRDCSPVLQSAEGADQIAGTRGSTAGEMQQGRGRAWRVEIQHTLITRTISSATQKTVRAPQRPSESSRAPDTGLGCCDKQIDVDGSSQTHRNRERAKR